MAPTPRSPGPAGIRRLLAGALSLRSPGAGTPGQVVRFLVTGAIAVAIYVAFTNLLAYVAGLPFALALALGLGSAVTTQFTLFRLWVWPNHGEFALRLHHQAGRFLVVVLAVYGLTAAATSLLPRALGVPTEVVYLACVAASPAVNFLISRNGIFHRRGPGEEPPPVGVASGG